MKKIVKVGSRDSRLAVAQTELVLNAAALKNPDIEFQLVTMKTTGDMILDRNLDQIGGKGLFVKELDKALLDGRVDFTVHSLKDLPMEVTKGLPIIGFSEREDPRDCIIVKKGKENEFQRECIGTSSRRRQVQLEKMFPEAKFKGIRGNVQTRLRKLEEEDYSSTILAGAGLKRLGMGNIAYRYFEPKEIIPAAGQGILVFQGREGEDYSYLECICSKTSEYAAKAERGFVTHLDGGCSSPIAAYAEICGESLTLRGLYYHEPAQDFSIGIKTGHVSNAEEIGRELAMELKREWKGFGDE